MFHLILGKYFVENNLLTKEQMTAVLKIMNQSKVKLGNMAVSLNLLTTEQADEINRIQATKDMRFGDIAVDRGYLTVQQVGHLLSAQGNTYLQFMQTLVDNNLLSLAQFSKAVDCYIKEHNFGTTELGILTQNDVKEILPLYINISSPYYNDLIYLTIRNIIRFIDNNPLVDSYYKTNNYSFDELTFQKLVGDHTILIGFASKNGDLKDIAGKYADETFETMNADVFDAVGEFINCINGLFARSLGEQNIDVDMLPPESYKNLKISGNSIYVVPIYFENSQIDFIISIDQKNIIQA